MEWWGNGARLVRRPTKKHLALQLCKGNALKVVRANPGLGQGLARRCWGLVCTLQHVKTIGPIGMPREPGLGQGNGEKEKKAGVLE